MIRATGDAAGRAAERLMVTGARYEADRSGDLLTSGVLRGTVILETQRMALSAEKLIDDLMQLVAPLEGDALAAVVALVRGVVQHADGVELAARRAAEALAADAAIRS